MLLEVGSMVKSKGKLAIIIIGIALIALALGALVLVGFVNKVDFGELFTSKWAVFIYVGAGLWLIAVLCVFFWDWMKNNG